MLFKIAKDLAFSSFYFQAKREVDELKSSFRLHPKNVKLTKAQVYDCPELKCSISLLQRVRQRINDVTNDIEISHRYTLELEKPKKKSLVRF